MALGTQGRDNVPRTLRSENTRLRATLEMVEHDRDLLRMRLGHVERELAAARQNAGAGFANLGRLFTFVNATDPAAIERFMRWTRDAETTADRDARHARQGA